MADCTKCGAQLSPDARFCASCGTPAPTPPAFCSECGTALEADARFCAECGAAVAEIPSLAADADTSAADTAEMPAVSVRPVATPVYGPALLPSGPPAPPRAESPSERRGPWSRWLPLILAGILVLAVAGAALAFFLTRTNHTGNTSPSGAVPAATTSTAGTTASASPASPSPTATLSPSQLSDRQKIINSLHAYFAAINAADYYAAWEQFTPRFRQVVSEAKLSSGDTTTQDSGVVVHWVHVAGTSATAYVTFTSSQDPAYGPNGDSLDYWTLEYSMRLVGGHWLIDNTAGHNGSTHTPG